MHTEFLNPYNFIPLPKKKATAYVADKDIHTGVIEYSITTRSPLFIPNTSSDKAFACDVKDHGCYDFYSYTELSADRTYEEEYHEPVIPGSELRGMLRSVYETLTDSCMGVLNEDKYPVMRMTEAYKAGLLKRQPDGSFKLVKAEDYSLKNKSLLAGKNTVEGAEVSLELLERFLSTDDNQSKKGYLIKGMPDGSLKRKRNWHIFIPEKMFSPILTEQDIDRLKGVLGAYQSEPKATESYKEYQEQLNIFLKGKGNTYFPVYYSFVPRTVEEKLLETSDNEKNDSQQDDIEKYYLYLAPACFTKELSIHSIKDLAGELTPCKTEMKRCPGCDLFGMLGEDNEQASASKIRFSDAYIWEKKDVTSYFDPIITLETLGSPRMNNVEFYLSRPKGATFWNYDYYVSDNTIMLEKATLRGRKYYWHQRNKELPKNIKQDKLNKTIRPVSSGNIFSGRLFFDGITGKQLNQLLWILNGGNEEEQPKSGRLAYKLGMGKPLGMGSVELKVIKLLERKITLNNDSISYTFKEERPVIPMYEEVGFSSAIKNDFFIISSLDATKGKLVTYPIVKKQLGEPMGEGFKWFVANHSGGFLSRERMKRYKALPAIKGVGMLPIYQEKKKNSNDTQGTGHLDESQESNQTKGNESKIQRGQAIMCMLTADAFKNSNGEDFLAYVDCDKSKGIIFGLPKAFKKGTQVKAMVNSIKENGFRGTYQK